MGDQDKDALELQLTALRAWQERAIAAEKSAKNFEEKWYTSNRNLREAWKRAESAEARVVELEAECASISVEFGLPPTIRPAEGEIRRMREMISELATLRTIADAAAAVTDYEWGERAKFGATRIPQEQTVWRTLEDALVLRRST